MPLHKLGLLRILSLQMLSLIRFWCCWIATVSSQLDEIKIFQVAPSLLSVSRSVSARQRLLGASMSFFFFYCTQPASDIIPLSPSSAEAAARGNSRSNRDAFKGSWESSDKHKQRQETRKRLRCSSTASEKETSSKQSTSDLRQKIHLGCYEIISDRSNVCRFLLHGKWMYYCNMCINKYDYIKKTFVDVID